MTSSRDSFSQLKIHYRLQTVAKMPPFTERPVTARAKDVPFVIRPLHKTLSLRPPGAQFVHF
ncbi:hypothetical protein EMIT0P395_90031 [Pseudomonas sp. IT-P395]